MTLVRAIEAALLTNRADTARELLGEALRVLRDLGSSAWVAETLELTAAVLARPDPPAAAARLGAARELRRRLQEEGFVPPHWRR